MLYNNKILFMSKMWKNFLNTIISICNYLQNIILWFFSLFGYNLCKHLKFSVQNIVVKKSEIIPITKGKYTRPTTIYILRGIAICNICDFKFQTFANATKNDNIFEADYWRGFNCL